MMSCPGVRSVTKESSSTFLVSHALSPVGCELPKQTPDLPSIKLSAALEPLRMVGGTYR